MMRPEDALRAARPNRLAGRRVGVTMEHVQMVVPLQDPAQRLVPAQPVDPLQRRQEVRFRRVVLSDDDRAPFIDR